MGLKMLKFCEKPPKTKPKTTRHQPNNRLSVLKLNFKVF